MGFTTFKFLEISIIITVGLRKAFESQKNLLEETIKKYPS